MLKKIFFTIAILCASTTYGQAVLDAVCKVHAGNSLGTGTCVDISQDIAFVFTNYHVSGAVGRTVTCQFYKDGHQSIEVPGKVVWAAFKQNDSVDMAMIAINMNQLGTYRPKVIKFGDPSKQLPARATIATVGCPEGKWPAYVKGHVIKNSNGVYYIKPPVENGRSGSALVDFETQTIVGIITWRSGDTYTGVGMAQDLQTIFQAMQGRASYSNRKPAMFWAKTGSGYQFMPAWKHSHLPEPEEKPFFVQILCPDGSCRPYGFMNPQNPPYNQPYGGGGGNNGNPYQYGGNLFPTLPNDGGPEFPENPQTPQTPNNNCDELQKLVEEGFIGLNSRLDGVNGKLAELEQNDADLNHNFSVLKGDIDSLKGRVQSLEDRSVVTPGNLDDILENKQYVTPGKLNSYVEKSEFNTLVEKTTENTNKVDNIVQYISDKEQAASQVKNAEEVGMQEYSWLIQGVLSLLGFGGLGGLFAWGANRISKRIGEVGSGRGGPQGPFPMSHQNRM